MADPLLTVAQVAERLQVSEDHVYRMVTKGDWPSYRAGSAVRIDWNELLQELRAA